MTAPAWRLVIHGGAGVIERSRMTPEEDSAVRAALHRSLDAGSAILAGGGPALDAVEAAVRVLEDDPHFNAGRGSVFTYDGDIEMDASIMDGRDRNAGAICGATATRNPISLARKVMEESPHVFLSREGADQFSREQGLPQEPPAYFQTAERRRQLEELRARPSSEHFDVHLKYGTVGAVALDQAGHVAAGTSTGGLTGKRWGRIGDSPVIGAGTYANNATCAVSASGTGEYFIRLGIARDISAMMEYRALPVQQAADIAIQQKLLKLGGDGGVIALDRFGNIGISFNSPGMYRAYIDRNGKAVVQIYKD
jgi:beta-aspartyl-peptidase (threonine type)